MAESDFIEVKCAHCGKETLMFRAGEDGALFFLKPESARVRRLSREEFNAALRIKEGGDDSDD